MMKFLTEMACIFLVLYKKIVSPCLPLACRFYPSCSEYSLLCFKKFSFFKAFFLSFKRICKCTPLHEGGVDFPLK